MATELTGAVHKLIPARVSSVSMSPRTLAGGLAVCLVLAYAAVIVSTHTARRDEAKARVRYENAQALVALPPASNDSLNADLASVKQQLATVEAGIGAPSVDPASDTLTALLIRTAAGAGLSVRGVSRSDATQASVATAKDDVQSLHITVSGRVEQVGAFLRGVADAQPALIASIASMPVSDTGLAQADVVFSAYAPIATPTAAAVPTARPR